LNLYSGVPRSVNGNSLSLDSSDSRAKIGRLSEEYVESILGPHCTIDVSPADLVGIGTTGDQLSVTVRRADKRIVSLLSEGGRIKNQSLPSTFLTTAAIGLLVRTERFICESLWKCLENQYGNQASNWWKGILDRQMVDKIQDRVTNARNRSVEGSIPSFLTNGEIRNLLSSKWEAVFARHFKEKERLLGELSRFEDYRNDVVHGRSLSFEGYTKAIESAEVILKRFDL
jgi:hypothetical protein